MLTPTEYETLYSPTQKPPDSKIPTPRKAGQITLSTEPGELQRLGAPLAYVQDQVGHEDSKTTQEIYARVLRRRQRTQVGAASNELMYGARDLAFRAGVEALRSAGHELLMESPFERVLDRRSE